MDGRPGKERETCMAWQLAWGPIGPVQRPASRHDDGAQRKAGPGHMAASCMLDLCRRSLHVRTRVRALTRRLTLEFQWIPSSLFNMFCRGVRSMEPFVSVRRLLLRWRMSRALCWRLHARAPVQTGTAHASCVESARLVTQWNFGSIVVITEPVRSEYVQAFSSSF